MLISTVTSLPPQTHIAVILTVIARKYNLHGVFYLDLWPLADSQCVILDGAIAEQITTKPSLPKFAPVNDFLKGFLGESNLVVDAEGPEWKKWRKVFAPAFGLRAMEAQAGVIVREAEVLRDSLVEKARTGEKVKLLDLTSKYAMDVVGRVALGAHFGMQKGNHSRLVELVETIPVSVRCRTIRHC